MPNLLIRALRPPDANWVRPWIADHWGWSGVFSTMVACCLATIVFSAFTLGHQATSAERTST